MVPWQVGIRPFATIYVFYICITQFGMMRAVMNPLGFLSISQGQDRGLATL